MRKIDFNKNWDYCRVGGEGKNISVTLPHDAMLCEPRIEESAGRTNTGWFEGHDYVYSKVFDVPAEYSDKHIVFEFEGVYRDAEIFINGKKVYNRPYGYIGFYVAADEFLKFGEQNEIRVIAYNADQPSSRWYSGAGIYRPVWMHIADKDKYINLNGVKVTTLSIDPAVIEVSVSTCGGGNAEIELSDGSKKSVSTDGQSSVKFEIENAKLWDIDNPNLYTCKVSFGGDEEEVTFGIRTIEMDAAGGFRLNGKRVLLLGACVHHDNGLLGAAAHPFAEERKVKLLKAAGYNALRSAHNPCSKALLDACDKHGMLMMDELVDMWYIHKTKYDYATHFDGWWKTDLAALIERDYNHPSVIVYSMGNEVSETAQERGIKLSGEMSAFCREKDPTRFVTCGVNLFFNYLSSKGMGVYSDKKAEKTVKTPKKKKHKAVGSEFFNNLAGMLGAGFMKFGATLSGSDKKTRDAFARFDAAGYNYGINRYKKDIKKYPDRVIIGSETFPFDAYKFYEFAKEHPSIIGDFVWTGMDYLGEAGIGAWEYRNYAPDFSHGVGWIAAGAGRLDITGRAQGEAAYTRVAYGLEKIAIAVVPADTAAERHSPASWRMTNAQVSWSWNGCDGNKTKVEVYARAHKVGLCINGKRVAVKTLKKNCRAVFKTNYYGGEVTAVAYDKNGDEISRTSLLTAGNETKLTLAPEQDIIAKDGLCYVRLMYTDNAGTVKPLARGDIKVSVKGGRLLGLGNGCPYNERGYLTDTTDTYYGEALAIIAPGADEISISAESKYGNANITVKVN